jgi:hypothetical protein
MLMCLSLRGGATNPRLLYNNEEIGIEVDLRSEDTVLDLKKRVAKKFSVGVMQINLSIEGQTLPNGRNILIRLLTKCSLLMHFESLRAHRP